MRQERRERRRYCAGPHLQAVAIAHDLAGDERADHLGDLGLFVRARRAAEELPLMRRLDEPLKAGDMDAIVAARADQTFVDFSYEVRHLACDFWRAPDAHAPTAPALVIGGEMLVRNTSGWR